MLHFSVDLVLDGFPDFDGSNAIIQRFGAYKEPLVVLSARFCSEILYFCVELVLSGFPDFDDYNAIILRFYT